MGIWSGQTSRSLHNARKRRMVPGELPQLLLCDRVFRPHPRTGFEQSEDFAPSNGSPLHDRGYGDWNLEMLRVPFDRTGFHRFGTRVAAGRTGRTLRALPWTPGLAW